MNLAYDKNPSRPATVIVTAKTFATANATDGQIVHFDPSDKAEPAANEPTILLSDYRRFFKEGFIERSDEAEAALSDGSDAFVPAGQVAIYSEADLARIVDEAVSRRLAGMADAEDSVERTTNLSGKATTAYPANQPVGNIEGDVAGDLEEDDPDAPPAPARNKGGRPKKVTPPAAPAADDPKGDGEQGEGEQQS